MTTRPRLVFDTNVLVSGLLTPGGPPGRLLRAFHDLQVQAVICEAIIAEYAKVLNRRRFPFAGPIARDVVTHFVAHGRWIDELEHPGLTLVDAGDQPFYDCAYSAACPLVTGNRKHFPTDGPVEVLTSREAVERLSQP